MGRGVIACHLSEFFCSNPRKLFCREESRDGQSPGTAPKRWKKQAFDEQCCSLVMSELCDCAQAGSWRFWCPAGFPIAEIPISCLPCLALSNSPVGVFHSCFAKAISPVGQAWRLLTLFSFTFGPCVVCHPCRSFHPRTYAHAYATHHPHTHRRIHPPAHTHTRYIQIYTCMHLDIVCVCVWMCTLVYSMFNILCVLSYHMTQKVVCRSVAQLPTSFDRAGYSCSNFWVCVYVYTYILS